MKYLIFTFICCCILPGVFLLIVNRRWLRYAVLGMILPAMCFDKVSLNFFSHELYRGTSRGMEISLIYLAAVTVLLVFAFLKKRPALCPDTGAFLYLLYLLLSIPSFYNAADGLIAFFELWKMIMMMLVFLAVYHYLELRHDLKTILIGFGIISVCNFLTVVFQHIRGIHQARGLFLHQNSMAIYMVILGTLFLSSYLNRKASLPRIFGGICFLCAAAACGRSYSRGAIASFPVGCCIVTLLSLFYQFNLKKIRLLLPLVLFCCLGAALMLPRILQRFQNAPKESLGTRKYLALSAVNMMKDKPFIGVGLNNWGIKINPPYPYRAAGYSNPHFYNNPDFKEGIVETIYLLVGAECGVFCLLGLLAWLGYYLILSFSLVKTFCRHELFFLPAAMTGGLTAVYLQSALEWVLKQQINFCQLMILFAVLSYLNVHRQEILQNKIKVIL